MTDQPEYRKIPGSFDAATGRLALQFDSDHPEFLRGFEAGQLWGFVAACKAHDRLPALGFIKEPNIEMALRIGDAKGLVVRVTREDPDGYLQVGFFAGPRPVSPERLLDLDDTQEFPRIDGEAA